MKENKKATDLPSSAPKDSDEQQLPSHVSHDVAVEGSPLPKTKGPSQALTFMERWKLKSLLKKALKEKEQLRKDALTNDEGVRKRLFETLGIMLDNMSVTKDGEQITLQYFEELETEELIEQATAALTEFRKTI